MYCATLERDQGVGSCRGALGCNLAFTHRQWQFIQGQIAQLPDSGSNRRLTIKFYLAFGTGLRLSELIQAQVRDFVRVMLDPVKSRDAFGEEDTEGYVLRSWVKGRNSGRCPSRRRYCPR